MKTEEEARWPVRGTWRSGHSKGYMRVKCPTHPNANADGYIYEHIYRASLALRRGLRKGETVHHVDGNPANNENSNLLVCTLSYHRQLHERMALSVDWPQFKMRRNACPRCKECGKRTSYGNKSGYCHFHYFEHIRVDKVQCRVDGCETKSGYRSGLCRAHLKFRDNKRRFAKGWDYENRI